MAVVKCFLIEPTGRDVRSLRRYVESGHGNDCPAGSYHNAFTYLDVTVGLQSSGDHWPHDDPRWPVKCERCDYVFQPADVWQVFNDAEYKRADTGTGGVLMRCNRLATIFRCKNPLALPTQPGPRSVASNRLRVFFRERVAIFADRFQVNPAVTCAQLAIRPAHITGFITTIVVLAIQDHLTIRSAPHFSQERFEAILPLSADGDPTTTVVLPSRILRIQASLFQLRPGVIFRAHAFRSATTKPVFDGHLGTISWR